MRSKILLKRRRLVFVLALTALVLVPSAAWLQIAEHPRYNPMRLRAEIDFTEGFNALQHLDYEEAAFRLERSRDLFPLVGTSYWLGVAWRQLGEIERAKEAFREEILLGGGERILSQRALERLDRMTLMAEIPNIRPDVWVSTLDLDAAFGAPSSLAPLPDGNLAVCDFTGGRLRVVAPSGVVLQEIPNLNQPYDVVVDENGVFYVSEYGSGAIKVFSSTGVLQKTLGGYGSALGQMIGPRGILLDDHGILWVADSGNSRIQKIDAATGIPITEWGGETHRDHFFVSPTAVLLSRNRVYVADKGLSAVMVLDESGNYLRRWTHPGLSTPVSLAAFNNEVYVLDAGGKIFRIAEAEERLVELKNLPGQAVQLLMPLDLAFDSHNVMHIADAQAGLCRRFRSFIDGGDEFRVEIRRVVTEDYPNIHLFATVTDENGMPFRGLRKEHFRILEGNYVMAPYAVSPMDNTTETRRLVAVVDMGISMAVQRANSTDVIGELLENFPENTTLSVIRTSRAGEVCYDPVSSTILLKEWLLADDYDGRGDVLPAMTRGIWNLLGENVPRALVLFTAGDFPRNRAQLERLGYFARFNWTPIYIVHFSNEADEELAWLSEISRGKYYEVYSGESTVNLAGDLAGLELSGYVFSYRTPQTQREDGVWTNLAVEGYYLDWDSYDRSGYFVPIN